MDTGLDWGYGKIDAWSIVVSREICIDITEPESDAGISVYPNPADEATGAPIQLCIFSTSATVNIYNAIGDLMYRGYADNSGKVMLLQLISGMHVATAAGAETRFVNQQLLAIQFAESTSEHLHFLPKIYARSKLPAVFPVNQFAFQKFLRTVKIQPLPSYLEFPLMKPQLLISM